MEKRTCKHCEETFEVSGRTFSNHVRWCDKNPKGTNKKKFSDQQKLNINNFYDDKLGENKSFQVCCFNCNKSFEVTEREKQFPKREKYYCSRSCSNVRVISKELRSKISSSLSGRIKVPREIRVCKNCNSDFEIKYTSKRIFCSKSCHVEFCKSDNEYITYKRKCEFAFNIWDYPDDFDLSLIYKYGFYKPKNKGDNLNGVSRDHKISVMFGWENDIDPKIISHPANCKLMQHPENIGKNKKCSVLLEQLEKDIKQWDSTH